MSIKHASAKLTKTSAKDTLPKYRVVDLFCGCGGLSRGLERSGRFTTVYGVDINKPALDTFIKNHGSPEQRPGTFLGDIRELGSEELWSALRNAGVEKKGDLDCLVGGPPCEGFSRNKVYSRTDDSSSTDDEVADVEYSESKYWKSAWSGTAGGLDGSGSRRARAYNPFLSDPRNYLFRAFLDIAEHLAPKIILIENVRQMLSHANGAIADEILQRLSLMGYSAEARVLNAADFGVPQLRQRAFIVAVRKSLLNRAQSLPWPQATHAKRASTDLLVVETPGAGLKAYVTVQDAIADLPPAEPEGQGDRNRRSGPYPIAASSDFRAFVRSSETTPANHVYRTPSAQVIDRLKAMQPGMRPHHLPQELQTKKYYYNAYARLEWDRPANTITKSFLYPGSGKFGHPEEHRVISYREAARLQSFDDDFTFHGTSQESISHMIGSAVPPLMGLRFADVFASLLDTTRGGQRISKLAERS